MSYSKNFLLALSCCTLVTSCDRVQSIIDDVTGGNVPDERVEGRKRVLSGGPELLNKWKAEPNVLVVVDFYSDSCAPCRELAPRLSTMAERHGDKAVILKVNVDRNAEMAQEYGVRSIPDVRFYLNGQEVDKFVGAKDEAQLDSLFVKHIEEIDDDLPIAERAKDDKPSGPMFVHKKKGDLPPGVERVKIPDEVDGAIQINSPAMKQPEGEKPVVDMGPPPGQAAEEEAKQ